MSTSAGADSSGSPASRFARARAREALERTELGAFRRQYPFELDPFQVQACTALQEGRGVLVAAPTGSGKTVVGEFAVHLALASGRKTFYTTPIKALSNQKYAELSRRHGTDNVGLLTGDNTVNGEAPIVVMTTEVLRNMLYADSSTLAGLGYVVMDEVHYLADRFRGAVWEEVIIHLPDEVLMVCLSATVSNAEEFGAWLDTVRGDTAVVVSEHRPVPLWQHVMVGPRLFDLFADQGDPPAAGADDQGVSEQGAGKRGAGKQGATEQVASRQIEQVPAAGSTRVNPELRRLARDQGWTAPGRSRDDRRGPAPRGADRGRGGSRGGNRGPSRAEVVSTLDRNRLLPAILFVFSRAGCEAAVNQCRTWGLRLTSEEERDEIRRVVQARCAQIPGEDLAVLGYWEWSDALERGLAAHHAGLLPTFKEVVEELFERGLVKAVFATETLALGVNMPARTVVLEKLVKWNGQTHADVTPGEYTQLTGRAGRRGIDVEGHAVVLWHPGLDPEAVGGLASTRTYPLRSSFRPTYNMAVNLVAQVGRSRAREILETSFAQFQADRAVVGLARQARRQEEALAGYREAMTCHLGDFAEYAGLRRAIGERESDLSRSASRERRTGAVESLQRLRRGDVIRVATGKRSGWVVVVDPDHPGGSDGPRPTVVTQDRQVRRLTALDMPDGATPLTRLTVPKAFNARNPQARRDLANALRTRLSAPTPAAPVDPPVDPLVDPLVDPPVDQPLDQVPGSPSTGGRGSRGRTGAAQDQTLVQLRARLRAHPCHGCADREDHARWAERWQRLDRETSALTRRIDGRTNTVARVFDRVCELLDAQGYLAGDAVTTHGERLRRIYTESDLLVAECLREGAWDDLDAAGLAACVSAVVYESRRDDGGAHPRTPAGPVRPALDRTIRIWSALDDHERELRLDPTREPDLGLAWAMHRWAGGHPLESVLHDGDLAAGDFVRWCKQVVDLLGQVQNAAADQPGGAALSRTARQAVEAVRRGVVAYSSLV